MDQSKEERDNFFRMTLLLFRVGNQKLREFFKTQWKNKTGTPPAAPWTDIPNDAAEMKKNETKPLKFQFKDQEKLFNSGDTNKWDFSLLTTVLNNSTLGFVTPSSRESQAIKDLKDIRNKLICHAPDVKIPNTVYKTEWEKACKALKNVFSTTQDEIDQIEEDVNKPVDVLIPLVKECLAREDEILNAIHKLEKSNEIRHRETIAVVKKGNEENKETMNIGFQQVKEGNEEIKESMERMNSNLQQVKELLKSKNASDSMDTASGALESKDHFVCKENIPPGEKVTIWKKSTFEELNTNSSGQHSETPARTSVGPSNSHDETQDTVDTSTTGSSQLRTSPVLLKDLIQKNPCVEDCLKNGLDYEYRLLSNWRHLAGELKDPPVPPDIIDACKCNTIHSPTWEVLGRPDVSIKPVEELMKILRTGLYPRKDVCLELSNGIPEADRSKSIQDVLLNKVELMDKIAMKLDAPATRVTKNWKYFAPRLGIQQDDIDLIERGNNPSESLLKHVYLTLPAEKKTAGEFRRIIMGFDNRPDLHEFVKEVLGIASNDDSRPLKSVIPEESEEMKKVTALLNKSTGGVKNWKNLAVKWEIDYSVYNTFDPPSKPSPTGTLLEWVCNNSQISVKAFLNILGEIKRYDVKEKMEAKIIRKCN